MESVPSLLPKGLSYLLYKDKNQGTIIIYYNILRFHKFSDLCSLKVLNQKF